MAKKTIAPQKKKGNRLSNVSWIKWVWMIVLGPVLFLILIVFLTSIGLFGSLPTIEDLANPRSNLASEIISSDQETIGKFYIENRSNVDYSELSPNLVNALIST